jgi:hypothetical protein
MKRRPFFTSILFVLLVALGVHFAFGAPSARERAAAQVGPRRLGLTYVIVTAADSGFGSLRWALQTAEAGDSVAFNPGVFPPTNPMTIALSSGLSVAQGDLLIDASNAGVVLDGSGAPAGHDGLSIISHGNTVMGLQILNFSGDGVVIKQAAQNNTIGGDPTVGTGPSGEGNVISGNGGHGVSIEGSGTTSNTVCGNYIGTDGSGTVAMPNGGSGVAIGEGASHNLIGGSSVTEGNVIAHNSVHGAYVWGASTLSNTMSHNSIHSNAAKGIELTDGGNLELPAPVIVTVTADLISDSIVTGTACASCTVEVFSDDADEGRTFWGSTTSDVLGDFTFTGDLRGPYVTATATDAAGNTSEFSSPAAYRPQLVHLPVVLKNH